MFISWQAISNFFSNDVLASADPLIGEKSVTSLEPILDIATQRLEGKFKDEPLIEASIRCTLGRRYWHIGKHNAAEANLKSAFELRSEKLGTDDLEVLNYMLELAWVYTTQGRYDEAEQLLFPALEINRRIYGKTDLVTLEIINALGTLRREQKLYEQAEELLTEALHSRQSKFGPNHPRTLESLHELGCNKLATTKQNRYCSKLSKAAVSNSLTLTHTL